MPTLSPAEIATLRAELQDASYGGLTDAARFTLLHAAGTSPNPVAVAPQVPKPFTFGDVMIALSAASLGNIRSLADRGNLIDAINNQDRPNVGRWVAILSVAPALITTAEATAINGVLTTTIADPSWSANVPGPSRKDIVFPGKSWTRSTGETITNVPLEDFAPAR